jgi:hypothetical protein|tara:strand:- start:325 stop:984 length:660 start_codon:yes stop_codon:yes gene_type:complete
MKIGEYKQMHSYLTRPDTMSKKDRKALEEKQAKAELDRKNKKRAEYDLPPIINPKKFVELTNLYDGNNFVVDDNGQITDEASLKKRFEKEIVNKTKELSEDKIVTKQRPVYPKEATPKQVGQLAERLERNRQMTGAKPTKLKDLKNNYKQKPKTKNYLADIKIPPIDVETYKNIMQQEDPKPQQVPEARRNVRVEDDPKFRDTIFGSDTYWRRMKGLDD